MKSINKLTLLQDRTKRFNKVNILKLKSHNELIFALSKKYPIFFDIIKRKSIPYKQFLSAFFKCIINGVNEPFSIEINLQNKRVEKVFDIDSSNYNYLTLVPWSRYNIIKCPNKDNSFRINKEQFIKALVVLFPKFIEKFPNLLLNLNDRLGPTISINHLYKYLVYCGDKLAKNSNYKEKYIFKFSKNRIYNFLRIFTYEQLKQILLN